MQEEKKTAAERVMRMERCYDELRTALSTGIRNAELRDMLNTLRGYYEGGAWLADYERDERGEFPMDLKRGVLSQDGVYDLLCEWDKFSLDFDAASCLTVES